MRNDLLENATLEDRRIYAITSAVLRDDRDQDIRERVEEEKLVDIISKIIRCENLEQRVRAGFATEGRPGYATNRICVAFLASIEDANIICQRALLHGVVLGTTCGNGVKGLYGARSDIVVAPSLPSCRP